MKQICEVCEKSFKNKRALLAHQNLAKDKKHIKYKVQKEKTKSEGLKDKSEDQVEEIKETIVETINTTEVSIAEVKEESSEKVKDVEVNTDGVESEKVKDVEVNTDEVKESSEKVKDVEVSIAEVKEETEEESTEKVEEIEVLEPITETEEIKTTIKPMNEVKRYMSGGLIAPSPAAIYHKRKLQQKNNESYNPDRLTKAQKITGLIR